MVDVFESKMCNCCRNSNCNKRIVVNSNEGLTMYKCEEYVKDESKIIPFEKPVIATARYSHNDFYET